MVRKGSNKVGWFLEVAVFAQGGWKEIIWLHEGCGRWGWRCFMGKLRHLLGLIVSKDWPVVSRGTSGGGGISSTQTYAVVLSETPGGLNSELANHLRFDSDGSFF